MYFDRCRKPRVVPENFVFIQVERDDGGRVLNLSEDGLCFEVFASISLDQPVHFWFSFDLRDRLEAIGRLVWMDSKKGIGGLQFTDISDSVRQQIRDWMGRSRAGEAAAENEKVPTVPLPANSLAHSELPAFVSNARPRSFPSTKTLLVDESASTSKDGSLARHSEALTGLTELIPLKRHQAALRFQFWRGLLIGLLIASLIAALLFKYANREPQHSGVRESPAQDSPGDSKENGESQVSKYTPDAPPPFSDGFVAAPRRRAADRLSDESVEPAAVKRRQEFGKSSRSRAERPVTPVLAGEPARKKGTAPDQLWAAVQAGNAKAAVTLADMYLGGDGVPENCVQAKVLLQVASQRKNAQAIQKLHELESTGCPAH